MCLLSIKQHVLILVTHTIVNQKTSSHHIVPCLRRSSVSLTSVEKNSFDQFLFYYQNVTLLLSLFFYFYSITKGVTSLMKQ